MQIIVFHRFVYACCTAFFQPFCGMFAIRYNVLNDSGFPHGCYRTLVGYKGSAFLGIFAISLRFLCKEMLFAWKNAEDLMLFV